MRATLPALLRCPRCLAEASFAMVEAVADEREVRDALLSCSRCGLTREVREGIVDLLYEPPEVIVREAVGLERFAETMRNDGWDGERIRELPDVELGYWQGQASGMRRLLATTRLEEGQWLLDVGSNTCWASNVFACRGLNVIALDIATVHLQGLSTAEEFMGRGGVYFERVLSSMCDPPLADETMDWVFCCQVLHHNDGEHLRRTLREMHRVLRAGGSLLVMNEPLRFPLRPKLGHGREVADYDGNEHVYFMHEYVRAARAAGFEVEIVGLAAARHGLDDATQAPPRGRLAPLKASLRRRRRGRSLVSAYRTARFWWAHAIRGDANLALVCRKPM
jgi:SAM-dependent methyltransferase